MSKKETELSEPVVNTSPKLAKKLLAIQTAITSISKNGRNTFQNYDYATIRDIVTVLKPLLEKHGVIVVPEMAAPPTVIDSGKDGKSKLTTILMNYKMVNIDDPTDFYVARVAGQGQDAGDKGIYKALTGAQKYFIINTFMVPMGDDPEQDSKPRKGKTTKSAGLGEDF